MRRCSAFGVITIPTVHFACCLSETGAREKVPICFRKSCNSLVVRLNCDLPKDSSTEERLAECRPHRIAGRIDDMHQMVECYRSCDALLFPSRLEGFGLAALEAQACGLPVIATQGSSLVDVVEDGRTGLLCTMDDVEAFVAAARRLAKNPTEWREMGEAARQRVATLFSEEQSVSAYIECYRKVLGDSLQHL